MQEMPAAQCAAAKDEPLQTPALPPRNRTQSGRRRAIVKTLHRAAHGSLTVWFLVGNAGMDPYSSPYRIPNTCLHPPFPTKNQTGAIDTRRPLIEPVVTLKGTLKGTPFPTKNQTVESTRCQFFLRLPAFHEHSEDEAGHRM